MRFSSSVLWSLTDERIHTFVPSTSPRNHIECVASFRRLLRSRASVRSAVPLRATSALILAVFSSASPSSMTWRALHPAVTVADASRFFGFARCHTTSLVRNLSAANAAVTSPSASYGGLGPPGCQSQGQLFCATLGPPNHTKVDYQLPNLFRFRAALRVLHALLRFRPQGQPHHPPRRQALQSTIPPTSPGTPHDPPPTQPRPFLLPAILLAGLLLLFANAPAAHASHPSEGCAIPQRLRPLPTARSTNPHGRLLRRLPQNSEPDRPGQEPGPDRRQFVVRVSSPLPSPPHRRPARQPLLGVGIR